eukprot:10508889-Ditylum_brightwellii.AAC.1
MGYLQLIKVNPNFAQFSIWDSGNRPTQKISGEKELSWKILQHMLLSGVVIDPVTLWRVSFVHHKGMVVDIKLIITGSIL